MRTILSIAMILTLSTSGSVAWRETSHHVPEERQTLWLKVAHCESSWAAEEFTRSFYPAWKNSQEKVVSHMNHAAGRPVCKVEHLLMQKPIVPVRKMQISIWDVWIYEVTTRKGQRFVPVADVSSFKNL